MTAPRIKEIACLCGCRERDTGQNRPRPCWGCGDKTGMGAFDR